MLYTCGASRQGGYLIAGLFYILGANATIHGLSYGGAA
jgi:hypothetical protein